MKLWIISQFVYVKSSFEFTRVFCIFSTIPGVIWLNFEFSFSSSMHNVNNALVNKIN